MKKGLDLGGMIDTAATPKETGIPQRGLGRAVKANADPIKCPFALSPAPAR